MSRLSYENETGDEQGNVHAFIQFHDTTIHNQQSCGWIKDEQCRGIHSDLSLFRI